MAELVQKDTTGKIIQVFIRDAITGLGKLGIPAAAMSGSVSEGNSAATALSFAAGSVGDPYSANKWAEQGGGNYLYHAPNSWYDAFGFVRAWFATSGGITAKVDFQVVAFDPNGDFWTKMRLSANQIITGTVDTVANGHTPTTSTFQADDITESTSDHYNGRGLIFTSGALIGQACTVIDYVRVGAVGQFTVSTLTEPPSNNDTFILV